MLAVDGQRKEVLKTSDEAVCASGKRYGYEAGGMKSVWSQNDRKEP